MQNAPKSHTHQRCSLNTMHQCEPSLRLYGYLCTLTFEIMPFYFAGGIQDKFRLQLRHNYIAVAIRVQTALQQKCRHLFLEPHWNQIVWPFCNMQSGSGKHTVFATCFWGFINCKLTPAADHKTLRLQCGMREA